MLIIVSSFILQSVFVADFLLHLYTHENTALPDNLSGLILINRATLCGQPLTIQANLLFIYITSKSVSPGTFFLIILTPRECTISP